MRAVQEYWNWAIYFDSDDDDDDGLEVQLMKVLRDFVLQV